MKIHYHKTQGKWRAYRGKSYAYGDYICQADTLTGVMRAYYELITAGLKP